MEFDPFQKDNEIRSNNELPKTSNECPLCKGTGIVKEATGSVHTCWDCLQKGKLDVHSKSLPDNENLKL